jgi:hypothetical protein
LDAGAWTYPLLKVRWWYGLKIGGAWVTSSSAEKLGRSSKLRTKSPCSPQAVGDTEADADVLLAVEVVAFEAELISEVSVVELEVELNEEVWPWLLVKVELSELDTLGAAAVSDVNCELDDEAVVWPFAKVVLMEERVWELGVTELELSVVAVGGPFASELPMEVKASVLGVTELRLVLETLEEPLVMSATSTELAVCEIETVENGVLDTEGLALELA